MAPEVTIAELGELAAQIDDNVRDERLLARRIRGLRAGRLKGRSWDQLLAEETAPGSLELSNTVLSRLTKTTSALRRLLARGLRSQGASVSAIAKRFGVTHQRVSALLHRRSD